MLAARPLPPPPAMLVEAKNSCRRMRLVMGTFVAIEASARTAERASRALEAAFNAVGDIERRMHPTRAGSELARINGAAAGERTPVDASTFRVLKFAQRLHALTAGVFDPCLPQRRGRFSDLELEAATGAGPAVISRAPLSLDLGGIAKGYAIDCAIAALIAGGCEAGLVNAGGDLRIFGTRSAPILLRLADGRFQSFEFESGALAVSDLDVQRHRPIEHQGYYRRVAVHTSPRRYAAVAAEDAMTADALTKCVLLGPPERVSVLLADFGARLLA